MASKREGNDPDLGARPLKRAIQKELETPIGRRILSGEVRDNQQLVVDWKDGTFSYEPQASEQAAEAVM